jgi:hypothetical protein
LQGIGNVTIQVRDVNDNPPYFDKSEYSLEVAETMPKDAPVLTLVALDVDDEAMLVAFLHFTFY